MPLSIDHRAVNRLARLLALTTEDARQLATSEGASLRLQHEVKVAAALAAELARTLKLAEQDAQRLQIASVIAAQAINKASSRGYRLR